MRQLLAAALMLLPAISSATMLQVVYQDQEPGSLPYLSRYIITPEYVRIDQGKDQDDFLILDRKKQEIFEVQHDQRAVLTIAAEKVDLHKAPRLPVTQIDTPTPARGKGASERQVLLKPAVCARVISVPQHPEVADVLREFRQILVAAQWRTWQATPNDERQTCDLQLQVLQPGQEYAAGMPLEMHYANGLSRVLQQVNEISDRPELFIVPLDYKMTTLPK